MAETESSQITQISEDLQKRHFFGFTSMITMMK